MRLVLNRLDGAGGEGGGQGWEVLETDLEGVSRNAVASVFMGAAPMQDMLGR